MQPTVRTIHGQKSWLLRSDEVELAITQLGGHMAPVTFHRNSARPVQPYYISPWQDEKRKDIPAPILVPLRGDFFCAPFGGNAKCVNGEQHTCHGEPATALWTFDALERHGRATCLKLSMETTVRPGHAYKRLSLLEGHNAVYGQDRLEGYSGRMPIGHHATLAVPDEEGSLRVATSRYTFGAVPPELVSDPVNREYQSLAVGASFRKLEKVPTMFRTPQHADCTSFPARFGYTDICLVAHEQTNTPAWTAATVRKQGYTWFSLKDAKVLPSLCLWISNHGRHGAPWDGRNRCLGLEDVCGHFADGLAPSVRANDLSRRGVATYASLSPHKPTVVNYIQGVARTPKTFAQVKTVHFEPGRVVLESTAGKTVRVPVRHEFLRSGELEV